jgi:hypothetical protein
MHDSVTRRQKQGIRTNKVNADSIDLNKKEGQELVVK